MLSTDGGKFFGQKTRIDDGNPAGRVEVLSLPSGGAIVSWIERVNSVPQLHIREVAPNGTTAAPVNVSGTTRVASGGFPKMVASARGTVLAWTDSADPSHVHTSIVSR
jgi:hypothetical protein